MSVCVKEGIFFHDKFCKGGGYVKAIAIKLNRRCPDVFPGELAEMLMRSCVAVDFAGDSDGETSHLCEEWVICLLLALFSFFSLENFLGPHGKRERDFGRLTVIHISRTIPRRHLSEIEAFALAMAYSYNHKPAASNATRKRVDRANADPRPF